MTSRTYNRSHNCGVHTCKEKENKQALKNSSCWFRERNEWTKGIMRTTSKITKTVCKILLESRNSNKLGDKFKALWGTFKRALCLCNSLKQNTRMAKSSADFPAAWAPVRDNMRTAVGQLSGSLCLHGRKNYTLPRPLLTWHRDPAPGKSTHSFASGSIKYMAFEWKITQPTAAA